MIIPIAQSTVFNVSSIGQLPGFDPNLPGLGSPGSSPSGTVVPSTPPLNPGGPGSGTTIVPANPLPGIINQIENGVQNAGNTVTSAPIEIIKNAYVNGFLTILMLILIYVLITGGNSNPISDINNVATKVATLVAEK